MNKKKTLTNTKIKDRNTPGDKKGKQRTQQDVIQR